MVKTYMALAAAGLLASASAMAQDAAGTNGQAGTAAQQPATPPGAPAPAGSESTQTGTATPPASTMAPSSSAMAPAGDTAATAAAPTGDVFTTVPDTEKVSSMIVGLDVYNGKSEDVATIKDIAYGANGVSAYILGVGGVLGFGGRYVAVKPAAVTLSWDGSSKKWHATLGATADQLKSAPEYKYPGNS